VKFQFRLSISLTTGDLLTLWGGGKAAQGSGVGEELEEKKEETFAAEMGFLQPGVDGLLRRRSSVKPEYRESQGRKKKG